MTKRRYFNVLELITENDEVETRDKCEAKITDIVFPGKYPLWGWYKNKSGKKTFAVWDIMGRLYTTGYTAHDLFMKGKFYVPRKDYKKQRA